VRITTKIAVLSDMTNTGNNPKVKNYMQHVLLHHILQNT